MFLLQLKKLYQLKFPNRSVEKLVSTLLTGLQGATHYKVTEGASDSYTFVSFIAECVETVTDYGTQALKPGDILVVDNAPIHHSELARILKQWLSQPRELMWCSHPKNPIEGCFSQIKSILRRPSYGNILHSNLHAAIYSATKMITSSDMHAYFRHTGFLNC